MVPHAANDGARARRHLHGSRGRGGRVPGGPERLRQVTLLDIVAGLTKPMRDACWLTASRSTGRTAATYGVPGALAVSLAGCPGNVLFGSIFARAQQAGAPRGCAQVPGNGRPREVRAGACS